MNASIPWRSRALSALCAAALATSCIAVAGCTTNNSSNTQQSSSASATANDTRTVTVDGTDYTIPAHVTKVAPTIGALNQITMMLTAGEDSRVAATATSQVTEVFKRILPSYEQGNPNNYDASDVEQMIEAGVQVAYGVKSAFSDEQLQQMADAGIVFIPMNNVSTVDGICETTEAIGQILGDEEYERAKEFTSYWKANIADCQSRTAGLDESEKPTVINLSYSNGAFSTEAGASLISSYIDAAGGKSLSEDYTSSTQGGGQGKAGATVDEEQIVAWNPDYIITYSAEATEAIMSDAALSNVKAVAEGHVYTSPKGLYLWSVRSGEGAMMAPWIGTVIHPDLFGDVDMTAMVKSFFSEYYGYDLSDDEAAKVLNGTFE
jgi:iron complex transport system substrate-binding protein